MSYEQFKQILLDEGVHESHIEGIWNSRPDDDLDPVAIRGAAAESVTYGWDTLDPKMPEP